MIKQKTASLLAGNCKLMANPNKDSRHKELDRARHAREGATSHVALSARESDTFQGRLRQCADMAGNGEALAQKTAIPRRTLETYLSGRAEPKASRIAAICEAVGVNANWLLTGEGPMMLADLQAPAATEASHDPDLDLLEGLVATVSQALIDIDIELPPDAEGKVIRLLYQLGLERQGKLDKKTIAEVIRLVA